MDTDSPEEVWGRTLDILKVQMTRATFDAWLDRTWVVEAPSPDGDEGSEWVIGVPNTYALDWLSHRLAPLIAKTLSWTWGAPATLRFVVGVENPRPVGEDEEEAAPGCGPGAVCGPRRAGEGDGPAVGAGGALVWSDFYIKLKVAFRKQALRKLKGARLSVFLCLSLHVDRDGIAKPGGIETIMHETGYSRGAVCSALEYLEGAGLIQKRRQHHGADEYEVLGYAWFGKRPAPALWESKSAN